MAATKPTIPYYAPAEELPAPLPTVEEIINAQDRVSHVMQTPVLRLHDHYAVKFGRRTHVQEGLNMLLVAQSTSIPVPKVYAIFEHEFKGHNVCFIVMEYIPGKTLLSAWKSFSLQQKRDVTTKLRGCIDELRSLPSPGYYGSAWEGPYRAGALVDFHNSLPYPEPEIRGPHKTADEFCEAMWRCWTKTIRRFPDGPEALARYVNIWRRCYYANFKLDDDTPVFTHGDFGLVNVLLADDGRLVMIDWEHAGWYPKYWEACHATALLSHRDDWDDWLFEVMDHHYAAQYSLYTRHLDAVNLA